MSLVVELVYNAVYDLVQSLDSTTVFGMTFRTTQQPTADGAVSFAHGDLVVDWGSDSRSPEYDYPGNPPGEAWQQEFLIRGFVRDEAETEDWGLVTKRVAGAIKKSVAANVDWYTLNGNAIDCQWGEVTQEPSEGGLRVVTVPLLVHYRISEYDPEVRR